MYGARYKNSHLKVQLGFCRHLLNSGRWALLLPLRLAPLLLRGAIKTKIWQKLGFGPNRLDKFANLSDSLGIRLPALPPCWDKIPMFAFFYGSPRSSTRKSTNTHALKGCWRSALVESECTLPEVKLEFCHKICCTTVESQLCKKLSFVEDQVQQTHL